MMPTTSSSVSLTRLFPLLVWLLASLPGCGSLPIAGAGPTRAQPADASEAPLPSVREAQAATIAMPFVANRGQLDEQIAFRTQLVAGHAYITHGGELIYGLPIERDAGSGWWVLRERLTEAAPAVVRGERRSSTRVHDFSAADPALGLRDLPAFDQLSLGEPYPGIDVRLGAQGGNIEKLFLLDAGADPTQISIAMDGADRLSVAPSGELLARSAAGEVRFTRPLAWQNIGGRRVDVPVAYRLLDPAGNAPRYGFAVGRHDPDYPLTIDPLMSGTSLGGNGLDIITGVVPSGSSIYVVGVTSSSDFPTTPGVYDETLNPGGNNGFIARLSADLATLEAATYIGNDVADPVLLLHGGSVYFGGLATIFPVTGTAYDQTANGGDDFVIAKLSADLDQLLAATYLGGSGNELRLSLVGDTDVLTMTTRICLAGSTNSSDFPVTALAYDTTHNGGNDAVVACLDGGLANLLGSTYFGTAATDGAFDITKIKSGLILSGFAVAALGGPGLPIVGGFDSTHASNEGYIARFTSGLTTLTASTYLGGSNTDLPMRIAYNAGLDALFVLSKTSSDDFQTTAGAYDTSRNGAFDLALSRISRDLGTLEASTFYGGTDTEEVSGLVIGTGGRPVVLGLTRSLDLPTTQGAFARNYMGMPTGSFHADALIARFAADLSSLEYGTYYGRVGFTSAENDENKRYQIGTDGAAGLYFPLQSGFFTPNTFQQLSNTPVVNFLDLDGSLPQIDFVQDVAVSEGDGSVTLAVTRSGNLETLTYYDYTVDLADPGNTATSGVDFNNSSGSSGFGYDSNLNTVFSIDILDNDYQEPTEQFTVILEKVAGAVEPLIFGATAVVTIFDDDVAGIDVSPTALNIPEAGQDCFDVVLTASPNPSTGTVFIYFSPSDPAISFVGAEPNGDRELTFTSGDWSNPKTTCVNAAGNNVDDGDRSVSAIGIEVVHPDPFYDGLVPDSVNITVLDDDTAAIVFSELEIVTHEADNGGNFQTRAMISLGSDPTAVVTVSLSVGAAGAGEGELDPGSTSYIFDGSNWNVGQPVVLTGLDDSVADGNQSYSLEYSSTSADPMYVLSGSGPLVTNVDDENTPVDLVVVGIQPTIMQQFTPGAQIEFTMTIANQGAAVVSDALVTTNTPGGFVQIDDWICTAGIDSSCQTANGTGQVSTLTEIAPGQSSEIVLTINATIVGAAGDVAELAGMVAEPAGTTDIAPLNNLGLHAQTIVSGADELFSDGFEDP